MAGRVLNEAANYGRQQSIARYQKYIDVAQTISKIGKLAIGTSVAATALRCGLPFVSLAMGCGVGFFLGLGIAFLLPQGRRFFLYTPFNETSDWIGGIFTSCLPLIKTFAIVGGVMWAGGSFVEDFCQKEIERLNAEH